MTPHRNYFIEQQNIIPKHRDICINFMIESSLKFKCKRQVLILGIEIFDKYIEKCNKIIDIDILQCITITSLLIASKFDETQCSFGMSDAMYICDCTYKMTELIICEKNILETIDFDLCYKTLYNILAKKRIKMNDIKHYAFCQYVLQCMYITMCYRFIESEELICKIIDFCKIVMAHDSTKLQLVVDNDIVFTSIYSSCLHVKTSKYTNFLYKMYSLRILYSVALIDIPSVNISTKFNIVENRVEVFNMLYAKNNSVINIDNNNNNDNNNINKTFPVLDKFIASGSYGSVYISHIIDNSGTKSSFATKKIKSQWDEGISNTTLREIAILKKVEHSNIIKFCDYAYNVNNLGECVLYISMELMDNTLDGNCNNLNYEIKKSYVLQLLDATRYIHSINIIHRDICPKNILIKNNVLKLADFGMARYHQRKYIMDTTKYGSSVCQLWYRSIDILLDCNTPYSTKLDVWSVACVIALILTGDQLFDSKNETEQICKIFKIFGTPTDQLHSDVYKWEHYSNKFQIWPRVGLKRLEKEYPLQTEILYKMFEYVPEKRITSTEAYDLFAKSFS